MKLTLLPQELSCEIHEGNPSEEAGLEFERTAFGRYQVFSDMDYESIRIQWDGPVPNDFRVSVNGERKFGWIETVSESESSFQLQKNERDRPGPCKWFEDCYGYIRIEVECQYWENSVWKKVSYYTDYLEVMILSGEPGDVLDRMFGYIGSRHQRYIFADSVSVSSLLNIQEKRGKTFSRQLGLLRQIQEVFETNLPFFKANPHSIIDNAYHVREFEKLRQIQPATISYIVQHPDLLISSGQRSGIEFQGRYYLPVKTLVLDAEQSRDCYENAVVMGFFETVIGGIHSLLKKTDAYLSFFARISPDQGKYRSSVRVIMNILREQLSDNRKSLVHIQSVISNLYWTYKNFLPVTPVRIDRLPKLTSVFLSVAPYRQIYEMIVQWLDFGSYSFRSEEFLLPFMVNSSLYEYYLLFKTADALEKQGFVFQPGESYRFVYNAPGNSYTQVPHTNTFVFRDKNERSAVLYYQPVIAGNTFSEAENNGIALRRVTTLSFDSGGFPGWKEGYYTPDYVLKVRSGGREKYLIADAKYRNFEGKQIPELAYKYAFAVQPASPDADLVGTVILYGKDYSKPAGMKDIFDVYSDPRFPKFWFTSLTESGGCPAESHMRMFENLIGKLL